MTFNVQHSNMWWDSYDKLTAEEQKVIMKAVRLLLSNPRHPSLQTHHIEPRDQYKPPVFEAYGNKDLRITFQRVSEDIILLRNCGHHDVTLRKP